MRAFTVPSQNSGAIARAASEAQRGPSAAAGHLWVFSNEVETQQTPLTKFQAGELVRVMAHNDRALGLAYVNPQVADQRTAARDVVHSRRDVVCGSVRERARAARSACTQVPYYRAVYGEADALAGLVIDRYGATCVVQIGTAGMERLKPAFSRRS